MKKLLRWLAVGFGIVLVTGLSPVVYADHASIYLSPPSTTVNQNETFNVQIRVNGNGHNINYTETHLSYLASELELVGSPNYSGSGFEVMAEETIGSGSLIIARGSITAKSGDTLVATLTFKMLTGSVSTTVNVTSSSYVAEAGQNVTGSRSGGTYNGTVVQPPPSGGEGSTGVSNGGGTSPANSSSSSANNSTAQNQSTQPASEAPTSADSSTNTVPPSVAVDLNQSSELGLVADTASSLFGRYKLSVFIGLGVLVLAAVTLVTIKFLKKFKPHGKPHGSIQTNDISIAPNKPIVVMPGVISTNNDNESVGSAMPHASTVHSKFKSGELANAPTTFLPDKPQTESKSTNEAETIIPESIENDHAVEDDSVAVETITTNIESNKPTAIQQSAEVKNSNEEKTNTKISKDNSIKGA